jgi:hypothetical protein
VSPAVYSGHGVRREADLAQLLRRPYRICRAGLTAVDPNLLTVVKLVGPYYPQRFREGGGLSPP